MKRGKASAFLLFFIQPLDICPGGVYNDPYQRFFNATKR